MLLAKRVVSVDVVATCLSLRSSNVVATCLSLRSSNVVATCLSPKLPTLFVGLLLHTTPLEDDDGRW